ncbi:MAG: hypothetical protein EOP04_14275, partial [Proteobacteria bacterium]
VHERRWPAEPGVATATSGVHCTMLRKNKLLTKILLWFNLNALVADAHAARLKVIPYTLRNEERFGTVGYKSAIDEEKALIALGVDGMFSDFPDTIQVAIEAYCLEKNN